MTQRYGRKVNSTFWPEWMLVHFVGLFLAWIPYTDHIQYIFTSPPTSGIRFADVSVVVMWSAVSGLLLGTSQWLVVRRFFSRSAWWILATAIGLILGLGIGTIIHIIAFGVIGTGVVVGGIVGIAQSLVLRRHFQNAGRWILASIFGWALCLFIISIGPVSHSEEDLGYVIGIFLGVLLPLAILALSAVTGFAMLWLRKRPRQQMVKD